MTIARQAFSRETNSVLRFSQSQMAPSDSPSPDGFESRRLQCMHLAASEGQHLVIQALVDSGANVGMVDRWGSSPLVRVRGAAVWLEDD